MLLDLKPDFAEPGRRYIVDGTRFEIAESVVEGFVVRRCELDPSLKATCFQPLSLIVHTVLST